MGTLSSATAHSGVSPSLAFVQLSAYFWTSLHLFSHLQNGNTNFFFLQDLGEK